MLKKRQNEVKRKIFLFDEVKKKNRSAIIAGWEDEAAINYQNIKLFISFNSNKKFRIDSQAKNNCVEQMKLKRR